MEQLEPTVYPYNVFIYKSTFHVYHVLLVWGILIPKILIPGKTNPY